MPDVSYSEEFGVTIRENPISESEPVSYTHLPLCAIDLILLKSTFSIIGYYLSVWQIVLIAVAIVGAVVGIIVLAVKSKPDKRGYKKVFKIAAACALSLIHI